ncbi:MAG TPA: hypothetical protein VNJ09_10530, partial [Chthonomonadales bacterium]|nr:hypothetical protein [Chthonomonadales bacterium]
MRGKTRGISEGKNAFCNTKLEGMERPSRTLLGGETPGRRPQSPVLQSRAGYTPNMQKESGRRDTEGKARVFPGAPYGNSKKEKYSHDTQV